MEKFDFAAMVARVRYWIHCKVHPRIVHQALRSEGLNSGQAHLIMRAAYYMVEKRDQ